MKKYINKNTVMQLISGFALWFLISAKPPKKWNLYVENPEPISPDYKPEFFNDVEYFGKNVIPYDYYGNWITLVIQLDKIRKGFGSPILIKKGFSIHEQIFNTCNAVEVYPQNNDYKRLQEVIHFMSPDLNLIIDYKEKNTYLQNGNI